MRILVIHNRYKIKGGEDSCFDTESSMLREHGHEVQTLEFNNDEISSLLAVAKLTYGMFYNTASATKLEKVILDFRPDVIHVHNFFYIASPAIFFVAKKHNIPIVATIQNFRLICSGAFLFRDGKVCEKCINSQFPIEGIKHGCYNGSALHTAHLTSMTSFHKLIGTWRNKVSKYIVLNDFAKRKLFNSSLQLKEDQIVIKPNCVPDKGYTKQEERSDYFVYVGRLSQEKGIDVLLKARDKHPFNLKIIGTGPLTPLVEEYAAKYENIEYYGFRDNAFILDVLKNSKALLLTSVWYEGMPVTILEAFSTGTPVIASDIDNINEIVENNFNGIHFKTGDADSLANIIASFNPGVNDNQKALYAQARQTFEQKYTREGNYNTLMQIYYDLVEEKRRESVDMSF